MKGTEYDRIASRFGPIFVSETKVTSHQPDGFRAVRRNRNLEVQVDVPGVDPRDIKIRVVDDTFNVTLTHQNETKITYRIKPGNVVLTSGAVSATVKLGVLIITALNAYPESRPPVDFEVPVS